MRLQHLGNVGQEEPIVGPKVHLRISSFWLAGHEEVQRSRQLLWLISWVGADDPHFHLLAALYQMKLSCDLSYQCQLIGSFER